MFGPHLTIDLYGCDKNILSSQEKILELLTSLTVKVGMHAFSSPQVTMIPEQQGSFDKGGLTGFVILVESHISIHTFPSDGFACLDIFSCKFFKQELAIKYVSEFLGAKRYEKNETKRGRFFKKHYPRNIQKSTIVAVTERSTTMPNISKQI